MLWRHGQTEWNAEQRFQGHTDVPLDAVGREQAARAARVLAALAPVAIFSSDLARALETAASLAELVGVQVRADERLRETYGGEWQGKTVSEIRATDQETYDLWRADTALDVRAGGGETRSELSARVVPAIDEAVAQAPAGSTVVVVTHGGTARSAIGSLLQLPMEHWSAIAGLANCCWSVLEEPPAGGETTRWRLLEHNAGTLPQAVLGDEQ